MKNNDEVYPAFFNKNFLAKRQVFRDKKQFLQCPDFSDMSEKIKKYSAEKQWNEFYTRSGVKHETARRIGENKLRLQSADLKRSKKGR